MPRLSPLLAAVALIPAAHLAGQASLRTSGGVARQDWMPLNPVGEVALDARVRQGTLGARFAGSVANFQDYGTGSVLGGDVHARASLGGIRLSAGPVGSAGRTVAGRWSTGAGGGVAARTGTESFSATVRWNEGIAWRPDHNQVTWGTRAAELMIFLGRTPIRAGWTGTVVRDSVLRENVFFDPENPDGSRDLFRPRTRNAHDIAIGTTIDFEYFSIDGEVGRRWGDDIRSITTWRIETAVPLSSDLAVVLSSHQTGAGLELGLPGSRSFTMGMRLGGIEGIRPGVRPPPTITVERVADDAVEFTIRMPAGSRVRLMGEMTNWQVVELERRGRGRFTGRFKVAPGVYRVNIAVDGGPWIAPPGMPVVEDGFGGRVGLADL